MPQVSLRYDHGLVLFMMILYIIYIYLHICIYTDMLVFAYIYIYTYIHIYNIYTYYTHTHIQIHNMCIYMYIFYPTNRAVLDFAWASSWFVPGGSKPQALVSTPSPALSQLSRLAPTEWRIAIRTVVLSSWTLGLSTVYRNRYEWSFQ